MLAGLFGRAAVPIAATLVLAHTQFLVWVPVRQVLHLLESLCDFSADSESCHSRLPLTISSSVQ